MKAIGYILSGAGFLAMVCGGCMCCEDVWAVPAVVFIVGVCVMALGMSILQHKQDEQNSIKAMWQTFRHSADVRQQQVTDAMEELYQKIIINEIWQ